MKSNGSYRILGLALLGVGLMACTHSDQAVVPASHRPQITFSRPIVTPSKTRASVGAVFSNYHQDETFRFWAQWDKTAFDKWAQSKPYLVDVTAKFNPDVQGWVPYDEGQAKFVDYDWPLEGVLTFAAFSPSDIATYSKGCTYSYGNYTQGSESFSGLEINDFTVNNDPLKQIDIMYAKRAYNCSSASATPQAGTAYNAVNLVFQHALSLVRITVRLDKADPVEHYLKKIEMRNVCMKGSFKEYVTEVSPSNQYLTSTHFRKWDLGTHIQGADTLRTARERLVVYDAGSSQGIQIFEEDDQHKRHVAPILLLLPQRFAPSQGPAGTILDSPHAQLYIEFVKKQPDGTFQTIVVKHLVSSLTATWLGGKAYSYNVSIGSSEIGFQPSISHQWTDLDSGVTINPE